MATTRFRINLADGHHIVGDEHHGAGPCYVFLHGLGSVREGEKSASLLAHARSRGQAFLRFDMRGHGESSGRIGGVAISTLIDDVVRILERTGPANIVGSSLGGLVGAHAAARRPDLCARLALLAPAFGLIGNLEHHVDDERRMQTSDGTTFVVDPDVLADARSLDEAGLPARLVAPTLTVHGTADDVIPPFVSEHFHAALVAEHKRLWLVPDGNHRLNTVADEIWRRLDELPSA